MYFILFINFFRVLYNEITKCCCCCCLADSIRFIFKVSKTTLNPYGRPLSIHFSSVIYCGVLHRVSKSSPLCMEYASVQIWQRMYRGCQQSQKRLSTLLKPESITVGWSMVLWHRYTQTVSITSLYTSSAPCGTGVFRQVAAGRVSTIYLLKV